MSAFSEVGMKDFVKVYQNFLRADNPDNPTKKSYRDLTSEDFKKFSTQDLDFMRAVIFDDQYKYIDQILPKSMDRADFARNILRELARRGEIKDTFLRGFPQFPNFGTSRITVTREPFGAESPLPKEVTELAAVIAIRDASVDVVLNNAGGWGLKDDVMDKLGKKIKGVKPIETDAEAYDLGYTAGAMPEFKRNDALNMRLVAARTVAEIQKDYCPVVDNLFKEGRAYDNRDSFAFGFMQARVDGRTNFEPTTDRYGLTEGCPKTPKLANDNREQKGKTAVR